MQKVLKNPAEDSHQFQPRAEFKKGEDSLAVQWDAATGLSVMAVSPRYGSVTFYSKPGGVYTGMDIRGLALYVTGWEQFVGWVRPVALLERALADPTKHTAEAVHNFESALRLICEVDTVPIWVRVPNPNTWRPKAIPHVG